MASIANKFFFSVSSWEIINYTTKEKKKKKKKQGSEQLSHGRGTKELRCITMSRVKKKKKGHRPNFWLPDSCTVCISYSAEALRWIRAYIPGFSRAKLIWTSCKLARNSQPTSESGEDRSQSVPTVPVGIPSFTVP